MSKEHHRGKGMAAIPKNMGLCLYMNFNRLMKDLLMMDHFVEGFYTLGKTHIKQLTLSVQPWWLGCRECNLIQVGCHSATVD